MRGQDAAASVPGSVSRCRTGPSGVRPGANARPQSRVRRAPSRPAPGTRPAPAQGERSAVAAAFGGTRPLAGRSGPQGPLGCAELGTRRASGPRPGPRPGSLDSEILVKVSKLPVHSLDVPAETRRPWGRGARSFFACDLVTLGGPGCPLGSRSPRGCQGLRATECSCVVSSKAPPGGSYVNGGSW